MPIVFFAALWPSPGRGPWGLRSDEVPVSTVVVPTSAQAPFASTLFLALQLPVCEHACVCLCLWVR